MTTSLVTAIDHGQTLYKSSRADCTYWPNIFGLGRHDRM
jgi:hypothetical protein